MSNRIIAKNYEWSLSYKASTLLQDILESHTSDFSFVVTPLSYTKLKIYDVLSFINSQQPSYCIILSFCEYKNGVASLRLYTPCYESPDTIKPPSSTLNFIPYQYGYRKNFFKSQLFANSLYSELSLSPAMFEMLPTKSAPLKVGIGIESPAILIEIGLHSTDNLSAVLTGLAQALTGVLQENK